MSTSQLHRQTSDSNISTVSTEPHGSTSSNATAVAYTMFVPPTPNSTFAPTSSEGCAMAYNTLYALPIPNSTVVLIATKHIPGAVPIHFPLASSAYPINTRQPSIQQPKTPNIETTPMDIESSENIPVPLKSYEFLRAEIATCVTTVRMLQDRISTTIGDKIPVNIGTTIQRLQQRYNASMNHVNLTMLNKNPQHTAKTKYYAQLISQLDRTPTSLQYTNEILALAEKIHSRATLIENAITQARNTTELVRYTRLAKSLSTVAHDLLISTAAIISI